MHIYHLHLALSGQAGGSSRQIVHEVGLSPIDVGLRDKEIPRAARTARDARRVHRDRAEADLPYLRGSVIVNIWCAPSYV